MGGCGSSRRSKKIALSQLGTLRKFAGGMDQWIATQTHGRLSLSKGEGEGEGLTKSAANTEPLTLVLSPSEREEAKKRPHILQYQK
jgi:hypothetical protein